MIFKLISRLNGSNRVIKEIKDALNQHAFDVTALTGNLQYQRARLRDQHGRFVVNTEKPVAYDSPDHLAPWGTGRDNSVDHRFNGKLINWILPYDLRLLDLGCSGGGQVRSSNMDASRSASKEAIIRCGTCVRSGRRFRNSSSLPTSPARSAYARREAVTQCALP